MATMFHPTLGHHRRDPSCEANECDEVEEAPEEPPLEELPPEAKEEAPEDNEITLGDLALGLDAAMEGIEHLKRHRWDFIPGFLIGLAVGIGILALAYWGAQ